MAYMKEVVTYTILPVLAIFADVRIHKTNNLLVPYWPP